MEHFGLITRKEFMNATYVDAAAAKRRHREYWAQFVGPATIHHVERMIGRDKILASTDPAFNDIGLSLWDRCGASIPMKIAFIDVMDFCTLSGLVCVAKEAAEQIRESAQS